MNLLTGKNRTTWLGLILASVYMVSYLTRINFGAIISEMEQSTGISRSLLSLSLSGSAVTYGIGQVLSGVTVDRVSPKKLISCGLFITSCMNLLLPLCGSPMLMLCAWCVNGFAQSMMWPPTVKIMTQMLDDEEYKRTAVIVSWGSSVGTILVYLVSPLIISLMNWKWVFWISSVIGASVLVVWQRFPKVPVAVKTVSAEQKSSAKLLFTPVMFGIMVAIILQGMLRDGVTTWLPSYIQEIYHWDTAASILTAVILPVFSIISFHLAARLYRSVLKNPMLCSGAFFGLGCLFALVLYFVTGRNAAVSVLSAAVLTGAMHGVNMMLITMVPPYFKRFGLTGTASGVLNSCTYIGSAVFTYGVAVISADLGWKNTVLIWAVIALIGTLLCVGSIRSFRKQFDENVTE